MNDKIRKLVASHAVAGLLLFIAGTALLFGGITQARAEDSAPTKWLFKLKPLPLLEGGCATFNQNSFIPFFDLEGRIHLANLIAPIDLLAKLHGLAPVVTSTPVTLDPVLLPEVHAPEDKLQVTYVTNPATGYKLYGLKVGGGPASAPVISGVGGKLNELTYAGHGQVAGAAVNAYFYSGGDLLRIAHDLIIPLATYTTQDGVRISGVVTQSSRFSNSSFGFQYVFATGGGVSVLFPSGQDGPVNGYHLEFGVAPSLTNVSAHGSIMPLATSNFGFDW